MKKINLKELYETLKVIDPHELEQMKDKIDDSMSEFDLLDVLGQDTKIITYPDLSKYETIEQVFNGKKYVVLLYLQTSNSGHWVSLLNYVMNGQKIIEFFDPYGLSPDKQLRFNSPQVNRQLGQGTKYLSLLFNRALKEGYKIIYNKEKFQQFKGDALTKSDVINTCGPQISMRIIMLIQYKKNLYEYIRFMNGLKTKNKISYDNIVSLAI